MSALFRDVEVPLVEVLAQMEWDGIAIDLSWFTSLKTRFQSERERVEQLIYTEAGEEFNINSNPKLRVILFEKLGLPVKKKTATGPSTASSSTQRLSSASFRSGPSAQGDGAAAAACAPSATATAKAAIALHFHSLGIAPSVL